MKTILLFVLILINLNILAQTKKFEATNSKTGKSIVLENNQRIKVTTISKEKIIGNLNILDNETISVNGNSIKLENIKTIKNFPEKGKKLKKIVLITGLSLVAGSGVAAVVGNGNAFTLFGVGAATTIVGGLLDNKNKTFIKDRSIFKIIK